MGSYSESTDDAQRTRGGVAYDGTFGLGFGEIPKTGIAQDDSPSVSYGASPPRGGGEAGTIEVKQKPRQKAAWSGCFSFSNNRPGTPEQPDSDNESESADRELPSFPEDLQPQLAAKYPLALTLATPEALAIFQEFASRQHAIDSVLLWLALSDYNTAPGARKAEIWKTVVESFLKPGAPQQVASFTYIQIAYALSVYDEFTKQQPPSEDLMRRIDAVVASLQYELEITDLAEVYIRFAHTPEFLQMLSITKMRSVSTPSLAV